MTIKHRGTAYSIPLLFACLACPAQADWFGVGEHRFEIPFVSIGDSGNPDDSTGDPNPAGSVDYAYQIGKFEVPEEAITKAVAQSEADGDPLGIALRVQRGAKKPATSLLWPEIARFVNWLNTDQGALPAYKFDGSGDFKLWGPGDLGYDPANPFRNSKALYHLPSTDEWYKAAYYDPATQSYSVYATGSDTVPTAVTSGTELGTAVYNQAGPADVDLAGGESFYGVVGQSGNVAEWEESAFDLVNDLASETRGVRGGAWIVTTDPLAFSLSSGWRTKSGLTSPLQDAGFRIARVPEPSSLMIATLFLASRALRRRSN